MSKALIVLMVGMLAVGCASTPTMKSVAGTYDTGFGNRIVLLDNGGIEGDDRGEKAEWKIADGDLVFQRMLYELPNDQKGVCSVNKDDSITLIAIIDEDGKREEVPKEHQVTWKKIQ